MEKLTCTTKIVLLGFVLWPTFLLAQSGRIGGPRSDCPPGELCNPLGQDSLVEFLMGILDVLLTFAIPIIVLFIMYAGFLYVTAQGDESKIKTAHAALTWSVVGGVIVLAANIIIEVIQNTVDAI